MTLTPTQARDRLLTLQRELATAIAANQAHRGDRITRFMLAGLTIQLRRWHRIVSDALAKPHKLEDVALFVGPNWRGSGIADLIDQSERHRNAWACPVEEDFSVGEAA
jgi:hypothetical protein